MEIETNYINGICKQCNTQTQIIDNVYLCDSCYDAMMIKYQED